MSKPAPNLEVDLPLRHQAEILLQGGRPPRARIAVTGADALALLHGMAIDPEKASDVLKLLHELQVHQVELDLQHEQLEQSRDELSQALARYVERYDLAPVAYFVADRDGRLVEGNLAAAELCGVEQAALGGRRVDSLVTPQSRLALLALIKRLGQGGSRESCEVQIDQGGSVPRQFQVVATVSAGDRSLMLVLIEISDRKPPAQRG